MRKVVVYRQGEKQGWEGEVKSFTTKGIYVKFSKDNDYAEWVPLESKQIEVRFL